MSEVFSGMLCNGRHDANSWNTSSTFEVQFRTTSDARGLLVKAYFRGRSSDVLVLPHHHTRVRPGGHRSATDSANQRPPQDTVLDHAMFEGCSADDRMTRMEGFLV